MSLTRQILGNTFWQIFGRMVTALIAFVTVGFLTNYWAVESLEQGQAQYGIYATIYEFLAIFGAIADLGIFTIAVREMSKQKEKIQEIFSSTITLRFLSLIVAMLLAVGVAYLIPQYRDTEIPRGVAIAAVGMGLFILSGTFSTILLVHLRMKYHATALVIGKLVTFAVILFIIFSRNPSPTSASFYGLIWAGVWGSLVTLGCTALFTRKFLSLRPGWDVKLSKRIFLMALPFGIATFLNTIYFRLDITMMGILLPHAQESGECLAPFCGDQQAGIYAVAVRIMEVLIILPLYFMNSVLPALSSAIAEKKKMQVQRRLQLTFLFLFILALPAVTGLFILARPIVELITPENFGSDAALQILTFPLLFTFFTTFLSYILIAFGEQKKILWINFGAVIFNFLLNIWAIPRYGFLGAAVTSLLSEGLILVWGIYFVTKLTTFSLEWKRIFGVVFSTVLMAVFTILLWKYWGAGVGKKALVVVIPLSVLLYAFGLVLSRTVDMSMVRMLKKTGDDG